jgi:hypothetical protein
MACNTIEDADCSRQRARAHLVERHDDVQCRLFASLTVTQMGAHFAEILSTLLNIVLPELPKQSCAFSASPQQLQTAKWHQAHALAVLQSTDTSGAS